MQIPRGAFLKDTHTYTQAKERASQGLRTLSEQSALRFFSLQPLNLPSTFFTLFLSTLLELTSPIFFISCILSRVAQH